MDENRQKDYQQYASCKRMGDSAIFNDLYEMRTRAPIVETYHITYKDAHEMIRQENIPLEKDFYEEIYGDVEMEVIANINVFGNTRVIEYFYGVRTCPSRMYALTLEIPKELEWKEMCDWGFEEVIKYWSNMSVPMEGYEVCQILVCSEEECKMCRHKELL